ncbi:MAG TPA: potassium-transporting ATPase subunit C [Acidimicrobiales bacterium]|nr:potassium-transporting ATPase subunit C [Acidimicrobiales bacterium]
MFVHFRRSIVLAAVALVLTFAYAFAGTGVAQLFFKHQADGSITPQGSTLIGQNWSQATCPGHLPGSCVFQGRPDDLGPYAGSLKPVAAGGDNPLEANNIPGKPNVLNSGESGATNLGPRSKVLLQNTEQLVAYWKKRGVDPTPDLVTTSGSGYDADITLPDALAEIPMVSGATGIPRSTLVALVNKENNSAELGFLGSSYINVLQLNQALAKLR